MGGTWQDAAYHGAKAGAIDYALGWVTGKGMKGAAWAGGKIPHVQGLLQKAGEIDIIPGAASKAGRENMQRLYGVGMDAVKEHYEHRAAAKLPPGHIANVIGEKNAAVSKFNPRLVTATNRLDPNSKAYIAGLEALEMDPKYSKYFHPGVGRGAP